jgi:hypothetical protein
VILRPRGSDPLRSMLSTWLSEWLSEELVFQRPGFGRSLWSMSTQPGRPTPELRHEQWSLFYQMVEAEQRREARHDRRQPFLVTYSQQGTTLRHPDIGLAGGIPDIEEGDLRALLRADLLEEAGSDSVLQVSGYGYEVYRSRPREQNRLIVARDAEWVSRAEGLARSVSTGIGTLVAFLLVAIFVWAILNSTGSASWVSAALLIASAYSFVNTAFGVGPLPVGRFTARLIGPPIAQWLKGKLHP